MTFLMPIIFFVFIFGSVYFAASSKKEISISVVDDPGFLKTSLKSDSGNVVFGFADAMDKSATSSQKPNAILYVKYKDGKIDAELHGSEQLGFEATRYVEKQLNEALEKKLLLDNGINKNTLDSITDQSETGVTLKNLVADEQGEIKEANTGLAYGIGFGSGILIYITMFVFGTMVMRGVAEEKVNRIAEVIVSSCKPFELMLGKIIGIAGVGLTQFLLWIGLMLLVSSSLSAFIPVESYQEFQSMQQGNPSLVSASSNPAALKLLEAKASIMEGVNWVLILSCFLFYFLGGYLFYAALFAAIGSVINEDPQEAQQLMLPITMPIIFSFVILQSVLSNPGSDMAIWTSIIPFTSPIIMMGRIPFGVPSAVPYWQLGLSVLSLIGGFILTTWFAGKIYRTGILLYGKKITWKEMLKWTFKKV